MREPLKLPADDQTSAGLVGAPPCEQHEVYAYDLKRRAIVWEFAAWRSVPEISESALADMTLSGNRLFVAVDQVVFALDAASGRMLWPRARSSASC